MRIAIVAALIGLAAPAAAQDIPSPYEGAVAEQGQRQLMDTLNKRRIQQAQRRYRRRAAPESSAANARAICRDKRRVAARLTPAKARQLYGLCARARY